MKLLWGVGGCNNTHGFSAMPHALPRSTGDARPGAVGPYTILEEIGAGAMGRVYRARDTRLNRDVAVKMLHEAVEGDEPRVRRFLEEARAAGALSHPNILAVYDVGTENGRPYIVSELIEGLSLRREIEAGVMPLTRALDLASQIADGLAAAHQAGLVHRDLKPDNVMVTKTGRVKIVDFGLAKAVRPEGADGAGLRTLTVPHAVLGTAPYMSPEQARGGELDFRSDLFSFGSILYEMVTGRRAFERGTAIETLTAVLHDEPRPAVELSGRLPLPLQWILQRCLAKAPENRYAATADLYQDIRALRERLPTPSGGVFLPRLRLRPRMLAALALVPIALAGVVVAMFGARARGADLAAYRFLPLATEPGYEGSAAWSFDGRTVAYIAERDGVMQVMTRGLESSRAVPITSAVSDCRSPFWSPDGTRVYYIRRAAESESLYSVASSGGTPTMELMNVSAAALSPNSAALVFLREEVGQAGFFQSLWLVDPLGSEQKRFAPDWIGGGLVGIGFLRFSPDGRSVAVWGNPLKDTHAGSTFDNPEVWVFAYPSGAARRVLTSLGQMSRPHPFAWMPDNRHVVFGADFIGASPGTHLLVGDTVADVVRPLAVSNASAYEPDVSRDGLRIAFTANASHYDLIELPIDGSPPRVRLSTARDEADPAWSASGGRFAYVTDRFGPQEIWVSNDEGTIEKPVVTSSTFPDGATYLLSRVAFAPDGQRLAYQRRNREGYFIWVSAIEGGPAVQPIPRQVAGYQDAPAWSPDGEWIAFIYTREDGKWRLAKMRPGTTRDFTVIREDVNFPSNPAWSPDGRWITCELEGGLYIVSPDGREQRLVSEAVWLRHVWSLDSSRIVAVRQTDDNRLQLVSIDIATRGERVLTPDLGPSPPATPQLRGFSLSADGTRVLTSLIRLRGDLHTLDGFAQPDSLWHRLTHNFFTSSPRLEPAR
jgi:eukaryotic-like serine/threonine-protein kinase